MTTARERMVRQDIEARGVRDPGVLAAMTAVARDEFVPQSLQGQAYADHPLPIGRGQTISQPYIVAAMTELLEPKPDHVVLEIGTGSGYQTAVLAQIVRQVYTVEIVEELGRSAEERLERLGCRNIEARVGDGYAGWEEHAPYDGILVTAAAVRIPPPLIAQLKTGGRLVLPVGGVAEVQNLIVVEKQEDGSTVERNVMPVRFVPLTGRH